MTSYRAENLRTGLVPTIGDWEHGPVVRDDSPIRTTAFRWLILTTYSLANFLQCLFWFTFSSVDAAKIGAGKEGTSPGYYGAHLTTTHISLLLNWGPIMGMIFFPVQIWLLKQPEGLARCVRTGCTLLLLGAGIRTVPCWVTPDFHHSLFSLIFLHLGQICVGAAGPLFMGSVSRVSCYWFPEEERATATAALSTANGLGTTIGFFLGPAIVVTAADFPKLLYVELGLSLMPFLLMMIYFPDRPDHPPSTAAQSIFGQKDKRVNGTSSPMSSPVAGNMNGPVRHLFPNEQMGACDEVVFVCKIPSFLLLVLAAGLLNGVSAGWQGLLQSILNPGGYSDTTVGWMGFGNAIGGNIGSLLSGRLGDTFFAKRFKCCILVGLTLLILTIACFTLQTPSMFYETPLFRVNSNSLNTLLLGASIAASGLTYGLISPLLYELLAEITYPASESTSAGILVFLWNVSTLVVVAINPYLDYKSMNLIYLGSIFLVFFMVLICKEEYKRPIDIKEFN